MINLSDGAELLARALRSTFLPERTSRPAIQDEIGDLENNRRDKRGSPETPHGSPGGLPAR